MCRSIILSLFLSLTLSISGNSSTKSSPTPTNPFGALEKNAGNKLEVAIGNLHAPLTIIMYYSLTCAHCRDFHEKVFPTFQDYIQKGFVRFVFRDFPTDGVALKGAKIAWCMGKSQYLRISHKLLMTQDVWAPTEQAQVKDAEKALQTMTQEMGIRKEDYRKCLMPHSTVEEKILLNSFEAQKTYGISAAPTFLINGKVFEGDLTLEIITQHLRDMGIHTR